MNQVKEIIIASSQHRLKIQSFVKTQNYKGVKIEVKGIKSDSESFGDALREVADLHVMKDDFIVVRGDIITNINIQDALKMHYNVKALESKKENQTTDTRKNKTIMTKIFLKQSQSSPLRDPSTDITLIIDSQTKEILKY